MTRIYGLKCSFNPTFQDDGQNIKGWISQGYFGLNQGPIVLMIENYQTGMLWNLMVKCSYMRISS